MLNMATVRLQMRNGHDIYFRAHRGEIHRLVVQRHGSPPPPEKTMTIQTEKNVPISLNLEEISRIHIM